VWFYCKVPLQVCPQGAKSVHALRSHMSALHFRTEPPFDCPDDDLSIDAFVWAYKYIGGWDAMEEFVACGIWPLGADVNFDQVSVSVTLVSKLNVPRPNFVASCNDDKDDVKSLARVESNAKVIVGNYTRLGHDTCVVGLHNEGWLNCALECVGVAIGPRPVPGSTASTEASKKRNIDSVGKVVAKHPKRPRRKGWRPQRPPHCEERSA
jgi:hypothetical protein